MKKDFCFKNCSCRVVYIFLIAVALTSCMRMEFYNQVVDEDLVSYDREYNNYSNVKLTINSPYPGMVYSVYFDYPTGEEGSFSGVPFMVAKTPIEQSMKIPKHVEKLYIVGAGGEIIIKDVQDAVNIDTRAATRFSGALDSEQIAKIASLASGKYFPERAYNFRGNELYKCTDLQIAETPATGNFDEADVWITYLGDGGFGPNQNCKLWFYTYPSGILGGLIYEECTFYGVDSNDNIVEVDPKNFYAYNGTYVKSTNPITENDNYLFLNEIENARIKNEKSYRRIHLGRFPKGVNIGFVFRGSNERCQFTTPCLNLSMDNDWGYKYLHETFLLTKGGNNISFTPEFEIASGFICNIIEDDLNVNILGMDDRCISHQNYDGDYNDMLCLIESNAILLPTVETAVPDEIEEYVLEKGIYLFEDNYPKTGDYDFNDVVVEYEIKKFVNASAAKGREVTNRLLAYGCSYSNEFGYRVGDANYYTVFDKIVGYKNVWGSSSEKGLSKSVINLPGEGDIRPYLYNGNGYVIDANYNTGAYPYVLIIPSVGSASKNFRWCIEGNAITDAYNFSAPRRHDWYLTSKDANLVIVRDVDE